MKKSVLLFAVLLCSTAFAQDTTTTKKACLKMIDHELGANVTTLLKQVLSFSNNNFPTLPYDITYKIVCKKLAGRLGAGISMNNTEASTTSTTTVTNPNPNQPPSQQNPDQTVPTINKSSGVFYRIGMECIHKFDSRLSASIGLDFIGQRTKSSSQNSFVFNNLPSSYQFNKTTDNSTTVTYGWGPVAGLQFFISKRLSIYTEMPVYMQYSTEEHTTNTYSNNGQTMWPSTSIEYTSTNTNRNQTIKSSKVSVILPVTLYMAVKF